MSNFIRIILRNKNNSFPEMFQTDSESSKNLIERYRQDSLNVLDNSNPQYTSIIYCVKCYDQNWHLEQIVLYKDYLKTKKDMEIIQKIDEHYGYKNFVILAHHKR